MKTVLKNRTGGFTLPGVRTQYGATGIKTVWCLLTAEPADHGAELRVDTDPHIRGCLGGGGAPPHGGRCDLLRA